MRIQAIRASETLYKAGDKSLAKDYERMTKDTSVDVVIQAMLTIGRWKVADAEQTLKATMDGNTARGVQVVGCTSDEPPRIEAQARRIVMQIRHAAPHLLDDPSFETA
jgi:CHASE3 domain sensor protein